MVVFIIPQSIFVGSIWLLRILMVLVFAECWEVARFFTHNLAYLFALDNGISGTDFLRLVMGQTLVIWIDYYVVIAIWARSWMLNALTSSNILSPFSTGIIRWNYSASYSTIEHMGGSIVSVWLLIIVIMYGILNNWWFVAICFFHVCIRHLLNRWGALSIDIIIGSSLTMIVPWLEAVVVFWVQPTILMSTRALAVIIIFIWYDTVIHIDQSCAGRSGWISKETVLLPRWKLVMNSFGINFDSIIYNI